MTTILRATNLSKQFQGTPVLNGIDLKVREGEVLAIIGPSGGGKSTLLRCLNLLETPDLGQLEVLGQTYEFPSGRGTLTQRRLVELRRNVGMVFQSYALFSHKTLLENVVYPQIKVLAKSRAAAEGHAQELLARVGLLDRSHAYPGECSGGQQQRAAIARALALDPRVLLFDEPTSALDPELGAEVLRVMRELAARGTTMVVVTHEMGFARRVADEVVLMSEGMIVEQGHPEKVLESPESERAIRFLGAHYER